jgi:hypothetical protein
MTIKPIKVSVEESLTKNLPQASHLGLPHFSCRMSRPHDDITEVFLLAYTDTTAWKWLTNTVNTKETKIVWAKKKQSLGLFFFVSRTISPLSKIGLNQARGKQYDC